MKTFYSCLDAGCTEIVPQRLQHLVANDLAASLGGKVSFYTAEDLLTLEPQSVIRLKFLEKPQIDGFIFYRLMQFCYAGTLNYSFLEEILAAGYSVNFGRERLSLTSVAELEAQFPTLYGYVYSALNRRHEWPAEVRESYGHNI